MPDRWIPVRPDLDQLKHQAKDLLRQIRSSDPAAIEDFKRFHPEEIDPSKAKLSDAQLVLARSYQATSWPRLAVACKMIDAIWRDDADAVREIVTKHPQLLHEDALVRKNSNWGPPMSYAANLGRDRIIEMLHGLGATVRDADGKRIAPVDVVLETDSRKPAAKHAILEMYVAHGLELPDTPTMAVHRGRIDLLEKHLNRDAGLLRRTFSFAEIYPPELGCHTEVLATHGTPLGGATLLHMCVDYAEIEIANWLLDRGMDVNAKAEVDDEGFGGHTALFATVVSQPNFWMNF